MTEGIKRCMSSVSITHADLGMHLADKSRLKPGLKPGNDKQRLW